MIQDIIAQAFRNYHDHVEVRFGEISLGEYLCVHDKTLQAPLTDDWKITFVVESHVLKEPVDCGAKVLKSVYGPKTEEIQAMYDLRAKGKPNG